MADLLEKTGLREVGLISFKACLIGKLSSLDILSLYLKIRKINHGWLIGYLENALLPLPKSGNPWHIRIDTDEDMYLHSEFGYKSADCDRIRLVKGNIDVILPGTRRFSSTSPRLCTRRLRLT
ncbi:hypothetical protein [Chelatococcus asaccharovorans]|uniref:hypothetical protein n=1 Tax=Chelatococcus asaccharovorans TaxID=28210 RepID=UPI0011B3E1F7|nr:hypothetical protein [Chelatococcus asaccharovorans]MBS7704433.1 hypothetical protein [Chelatococcus asaccharovorans]